jgi:hypothetical protein
MMFYQEDKWYPTWCHTHLLRGRSIDVDVVCAAFCVFGVVSAIQFDLGGAVRDRVEERYPDDSVELFLIGNL